MRTNHYWAIFFASTCCLLVGCATARTSNTARTGTEQMLVSSAVDRVLSDFKFDSFQGQAVMLDDQYLDSVDKGYVVSAMRHRLFRCGARLVSKPEEADVVLEVRSGGVGTDSQESFVGIPALAVPGMAIELPEIKLINRATQFGTAKIGIVAYDPKSGEAIGRGGESLSRSNNDQWYVFGVGPWRGGSMPKEIKRNTGTTTGVQTTFPGMPESSAPRLARHRIPLAEAEYMATKPTTGSTPVGESTSADFLTPPSAAADPIRVSGSFCFLDHVICVKETRL